MYAYVEGKLNHKDPATAVVDVNGLGFLLRISLQTFSALPNPGEKTKLYVFLSIREDAHTLFGFAEMAEKLLFEDLISVSGIGPSIAMVMLSSLSTAEIKRAIVTEDLRTIQGVKGIGAKTAQRAIIELKDKLKKDQMAGDGPSQLFPSANRGVQTEAVAALAALGIPKNVAEKSVESIVKREGQELSVEQLIKMALK